MAKSRWTVTRTLLALVLALTIPITGFTIFVLMRHALDQQTRYASEAEQIAGFVSSIVDRELSNFAALLRGASNSNQLQAGDFEGFYREASRLVAGTEQAIILRGLDQHQIVNTGHPFGGPLPSGVPITPEDREAYEAGRSVIGGVYKSPASGELRVPVSMPVTINGELLLLGITIPAEYFLRVIVPAAPPGWVITIGDAQGTIVARSLENETYAGQAALPEYLALADRQSGSFRVNGFGGRALLTGYNWSPLSGWITGANIPVDVIEAPLRTSLGGIVAVALGAAAIAGAISAAFIRRFRVGALTLLQQASAGEGHVAAPPNTGLKEFDEVIDALTSARAQRAEAERSLRERTQELEVVLQTAPAAVWFTNDREVKRVRANAHAARLLRVPEDSDVPIASGLLTHLAVYKDGRPGPMEDLPLDRAFRGEHLRDEEYLFRFDDGTEITLLTSAEPLRGPNGEINGSVAIGIDISERKRNDEQQKLLINELNHRVKNTLTTVQSIARRSLRTAGSLREAETALSDRLVAIAKAYDVLTREHWQGSSVAAMIENTIGPYMQQGRVQVAGPDFWLSPSNSVTFSLIVHELAVNATKHGALSGDQGRIDVTWEAEEEPGATVLTLTWRESGGPPVKPPERTGFGSDLLRRLTESGGSQHRMDFEPAGLVCVFSLRQQHRAEGTAPVDAAALPS